MKPSAESLLKELAAWLCAEAKDARRVARTRGYLDTNRYFFSGEAAAYERAHRRLQKKLREQAQPR